MPRWLEQTYDSTHAIATGTIGPLPNSSTAMTVQESGVGACSAHPSVDPSVAPITNSGVTSPPWNPDPSVTAVNSSFHANASTATPAPPASDAVIKGSESPR